MIEFKKFFDSKRYILGEGLMEFEKKYAAFSGAKYAIGVGNGLDALHLSLVALGIGKGDEVILPSNTFIATVLAVSYAGAIPVFVEPDIHTYNIDPQRIVEAINSKTKAIMPVHLYGQACQMDEICRIANENGLVVIEDNAQAQGANCNGKLTGSFGHLNGTSFYPGKNLGAFGDAGAITTNDSSLAEKLRVLRNYGSERKYYNEYIGYNSRLDELQASLLSVKLGRLIEWNKERNRIAELYGNLLDGSKVVIPRIAESCTSVYHLYVIRHKKRDKLQEYLKSKGIDTLIHYPIPPHLQQAYRSLGVKKGDFPIAERLADEVLSLPLFIGMTEEQVSYVCHHVNQF